MPTVMPRDYLPSVHLRCPSRSGGACVGPLVGFAALSLLLGAGPAAAQTEQSQLRDPPFRIIGFADVDYDTTDVHGKEGFSLGQAVAHVVAPLGDRLNLFGEFSATAHDSEYQVEVERLIIKHDFSNSAALSAGRFHTPIGYWNTAFHHGAWLQTTISRPESVKFGSQFVPIHFVGALFEGDLPGRDLGLGYSVGVGNGRHSNIARAGDAGDVNDERAWTVSGFYEPRSARDLKAGIGVYGDRVSPPGGVEVDETIYSAYVAFERETPEVVAEYIRSEHDTVAGPGSGGADSFYVQVAYRLGGSAERWKPYARAEQIDVDGDDPLLGGRGLDYEGLTAGLRFDFATYAALKFEYRDEKFGQMDRESSFLVQLSVVLARD
jgi:hypothetical protein